MLEVSKLWFNPKHQTIYEVIEGIPQAHRAPVGFDANAEGVPISNEAPVFIACSRRRPCSSKPSLP